VEPKHVITRSNSSAIQGKLPAGSNVTALVRVGDSLGAEAMGRRPGLVVNGTNNGTLILASVKAFANITSELSSRQVDALMGVLRDASASLDCGGGRPCVNQDQVTPLAGTVLGVVQTSVERLDLTIPRAEVLAAALVPLANVLTTQADFVQGVLSTLNDLVEAVDSKVGLFLSSGFFRSCVTRVLKPHNNLRQIGRATLDIGDAVLAVSASVLASTTALAMTGATGNAAGSGSSGGSGGSPAPAPANNSICEAEKRVEGIVEVLGALVTSDMLPGETFAEVGSRDTLGTEDASSSNHSYSTFAG
jgi:hypothetical protein